MIKAAKTRFNSIQDQLKNSDKADRLLISLNRICGQKNQFYKPTKELAGKIRSLTENKSPKSILIVGDPTLLTIDERFKNAGAEITLTLVSDRVPEDRFDLAARRISKYCEAYNIKRIVRFEDLIEKENRMHFDLIIANPPYGSIGANITKKIIDAIDFGEYINLLPLTDYKKEKSYSVSCHIMSVVEVSFGTFEDAAVTTAIAKISKVKVNDITASNLKLEMKDFRILNKYFRTNAKSSYELPIRQRSFRNMEDRFAVAIGHRDAAHGHLPYSKNTAEYRFNHNELSQTEYEKEVAETLYGNPTGNLTSDPIFFKTKEEADNYKAFIYSEEGFKFTAFVWSSYSTDSSQAYEDCFPRVDWTRPWTVQEILKDYGYTEEEIQDVMDSLKDYRYLND